MMLKIFKIILLIKSNQFQSIPLLFNGKISKNLFQKNKLSFRITSAWYLFGRQQVSKYHEQAKNIIHLHLCLLRLGEDLATDILISFNDPVFVRYNICLKMKNKFCWILVNKVVAMINKFQVVHDGHWMISNNFFVR